MLIINTNQLHFYKKICLWCCSREYTAQEPIWMAPCVNVSLKCVIPEQLGSCVWWRELGFIIASTGDWMSPGRERQTETQRPRERRREEERHHTDSMNDTSYDCLGQSCSLWLPILHSPTVLHFTSPSGLIYYTQQNCYRLDSVWLPVSFQTFSQGNVSRMCVLFLFIILFSAHIFPRSQWWLIENQ